MISLSLAIRKPGHLRRLRQAQRVFEKRYTTETFFSRRRELLAERYGSQHLHDLTVNCLTIRAWYDSMPRYRMQIGGEIGANAPIAEPRGFKNSQLVKVIEF